MSPHDKPLVWLAGEVKTPPFSEEARIEAGFLLRKLQRGDKLPLQAAAASLPGHSLAGIGGAFMDKKSKRKLESEGWTTDDTREFLGLTDAEAEFIEMKLALADELRAYRLARHLNQTQVARIVGSSQSRVAKMEAADPSVTIDLLVQTLLKLGAARKDVASAVAPRVEPAGT